MKLKALKPLMYATRRLQAGDVFEAKTDSDRKILLATRKVEAVQGKSPRPRAPAVVPAAAGPEATAVPAVTPPASGTVGAITTAQSPNAPGGDDRAALRTEYESVVGKAPFPGWSADMLREKIAAAKTGIGK